jgi:ubiquinone/menaquinone biosynthesis C-methylase UbiE
MLQTAKVRLLYSGVSLALRNEDWTFMNYGFSPLDADAGTRTLDAADENDRLSIQLYDRVAAGRDLRGKDVLEIGSGRGGGASFVMRYLGPASMTGVDLSAGAVRYCRRRHPVPGLSFVRGDAGRLPHPSGSFDAVFNVESSHAYPSFERFLDEVVRVLRPGGIFLFADLRGRDEVEAMRDELKGRFTLAEEEVITPNVVRALDLDTERRRSRVQKRAPRFLQEQFQCFAGVHGSPVYEALASGNVEYVRFVLEKGRS